MKKIRKQLQRQNNSEGSGWSWVLLGVLINVLYLPSLVFMKLIVDDIGPSLMPALRYGLAALVFLPFVVRGVYKHRMVVKKHLLSILLVCSLGAIAPLCYSVALSMCDASFVAVLDMFSPIVFAIISIAVLRDKVTGNALIGLLFAILGGIIIFVLPLFVGTGSVITFGWLPVVLITISIAMPQLSTVFYRKWNEAGLPIMLVVGLGCIAAAIAAIIFTIVSSGPEVFAGIGEIKFEVWLMLLYLGVVSSVILRVSDINVYKRIGTATQATLAYLYYVLAVFLPIVLLGEQLSWEMFVGAVFVLIGIIFTRIHKNGHHHAKAHH